MKTKSLFLILNILLITTIYAQKEGNIWYFGHGAGLDFTSGSPVKLTNGMLYTFEGCASICDHTGALLFYTDGSTIYNKKHQLMLNGNNLLGDNSSTQSAIIVKKPRSNSLYYVFTVDNAGGPNGLRFSIVNRFADNGLGAVTSKKNIIVLLQSCEKIAVVRHKNETDFWIIAHHFGSNKFYSFLLTSKGIDVDNPVISPVGAYLNNNLLNTLGYLKASPDGRHLANANYLKGSLEILDFDRKTGEISNPMTFYPDLQASPYGTEFSPNSKLVYVSDYKTGNVHQYDLSSGIYSVIEQTKTRINSISGSSVNGALVLAPDKKIYYALNGERYLSVINNPDLTGLSCGFKFKVIYLGSPTSGIGLPTFYSSIYSPKTFSFMNTCYGDSTTFDITDCYFDSLLWNFGDINSQPNNTSQLIQPKHVFSSSGKYKVILILYSNGIMDTLSEIVEIDPIKSHLFGNDTTVCMHQTMILSVNNDYEDCVWSNLSTASSIQIFGTGDYWVTLKTRCGILSDTISVSFVECNPRLIMPNIITPNSDGVNDYFIPIVMNSLSNGKIQIFNRWGGKVYENSLSNPWNGKLKDKPCAQGTYLWIASFTSPEGNKYSQKGTVSIIR